MAEKRPNPFQKYLDAPDIEDDTPITPKRVNPFQKYLDAPDPEETPERTIGGTIKDIGISTAKGIIGAGEAAVGIANIPTFGYAGKTLEKVGYKPKETQDILSSQFSPAQKEANQKLEEAKGFLPSIKTAIQNPSTIGLSLVESVPSIAGGGAIARGAMKFAPKLAPLVAGAIGEGTVSAGSFAESTRQQTEDGTLSLKQTALAPVVGGLTGAFSLAGGRLAKKLGFEDIDTLIAGNKLSTDKRNIFARIIGGGISEGVFEELPQSAQEQLISNAALDRPLFDGVPEAAAMGLVTGAVMGGGINALPNRTQPETAPAAPPQAPRFLPTGPISKALSSLPTPRDIAAPPTTGDFAPGFGETAQAFAPPDQALPTQQAGQQAPVANRLGKPPAPAPIITTEPIRKGVSIDRIRAQYGPEVSAAILQARNNGAPISIDEAIARTKQTIPEVENGQIPAIDEGRGGQAVNMAESLGGNIENDSRKNPEIVNAAAADKTPIGEINKQQAPRVTVGDREGWLNDNAQRHRDFADKRGITSDIESMLAKGLTAGEVTAELKRAGKLKGIDAEELSSFVVGVRATLGIPSRMGEEGKADFDKWLESYNSRNSGGQNDTVQQNTNQNIEQTRTIETPARSGEAINNTQEPRQSETGREADNRNNEAQRQENGERAPVVALDQDLDAEITKDISPIDINIKYGRKVANIVKAAWNAKQSITYRQALEQAGIATGGQNDTVQQMGSDITQGEQRTSDNAGYEQGVEGFSAKDGRDSEGSAQVGVGGDLGLDGGAERSAGEARNAPPADRVELTKTQKAIMEYESWLDEGSDEYSDVDGWREFVESAKGGKHIAVPKDKGAAYKVMDFLTDRANIADAEGRTSDRDTIQRISGKVKDILKLRESQPTPQGGDQISPAPTGKTADEFPARFDYGTGNIVSDAARELRAKSYPKQKRDDDVFMGSSDNYVSLKDAAEMAREAIDAGVRPVAFQIAMALDIAPGWGQKVLDAANKITGKPTDKTESVARTEAATPSQTNLEKEGSISRFSQADRKKKPQKKTAKQVDQELSEYLTPGNIVKSYYGHDRITSFSISEDGKLSVGAVAVKKDANGNWKDIGKPRIHGTMPSKRDLSSGPVQRAEKTGEAGSAYSPETSEPSQGPKSETTLSDILAKAKDSTNPTTKQLAQLLADFIPGSKLDTKVIIDPSIKSAKYTGKTNTITIKDAAALETSLHEIVHAVTVNEMEANPEIKRRVTRLMNTVKRKAIAQGILSAQNITDIETAGGSRAFKNRFPAGSLSGVENIAYAFLNEKEFLAQAFSSPQFQGLLKSTKLTDRGGLRRAFDVFVELVMKALGFKNVNGDAFSEAVKLVAELASKENGAINQFAQGEEMSLDGAMEKIQSTEAFKKWFGDSEVVDEEGNPLVVYHGGESIRTEFSEKAKRGGALGVAYFTNNKSVAEAYAKTGVPPGYGQSEDVLSREGGVTEAFLNISKPVPADPESFFNGDMEAAIRFIEDDIDDNVKYELEYLTDKKADDFWDLFLDSIPPPRDMSAANSSMEDYPFLQYLDSIMVMSQSFREKIQKDYDGFIFDDAESGGVTYVVFAPTQIKSIFNTKFDPTNPDIMESYEESGFSEINPPTIGKTKAQIAAEREDRYAANRVAQRDFKRKVIRNTRSAVGKVMQGIDKFLGAASTRLKNIHPKLQEKLRDLDFFTGTNLTRDVKAVEPMLRKAKEMSREDFADWDLARKNSDKEKIDELIKKYSLQEEYAAYREVLDRLRDEANHVGMDIGWIKEYAPRAINDAQGFLNAVGKGDMRPVITDAIEKRAKFLGISVAEMTPEMKADIVSNMLFGGWSGVGKPGNTKERTIKEIPPELNQFYMDSDAALMNYLHSIRKHVEMRKFFGKLPRVISEAKSAMHAAQARLRKATAEDEAKYMEMHEHTKGEPFPETERMKEIKDTIAQHKYVLDTYKNTRTYSENISDFFLEMQSEGIVKPEDEMTLINILNARFHERGTYGAIQTYKNLSYIDTMGSFTSAITQIGDFVWTVYSNGWYRTAKGVYGSVTGKARIKKEDVGIERIAQEFAGTDTMSNAVAAVFKFTGLSKMDSIGKEAFLNAALEKFEQRAVKDQAKLKEEIKNIFEAETDSVIADLQNKRITGNVKRLVYGNLLDFQPAALSEQSEQYMKAGNGRVFYMLKSYTLKQFDVFRREIYTGLKSGDKKQVLTSLQNFAYLTALLVVANAGADELKDFVTGRKTNFEDRVVDNVLKLFGVSKYVTWKARTEGAGTALAKQILPPFKFFDSLYKDVMSAGDEKGLEVVNSIPIVGKLAYWHLGRGSHNRKDYAEIRFAKRRKTLNDIKDKTEQDPSLKRNYREELAELHAMERFQAKLNVKKKNINRLEAIEKRTGRDLSDRIGAAKAARIQMIEEYLAQN